MRKKDVIVSRAMMSSEDQERRGSQVLGRRREKGGEEGEAVPKVLRPRAWRRIWSMWWRAAVVVGEVEALTEETREVAVEAIGGGGR